MMYASKPHVVVVRLYVGINVHICNSEKDGVLTPLLPFSGPDDELGAASLVLH